MRHGRNPPHGRRAALTGALALALVVASCSGPPDSPGNSSPTTEPIAASTLPITPPAVGPIGGPSGTVTSDMVAFAEFVDASYGEWLARHPQFLTSLGIADRFGLRNDRLDDLSEEYTRETEALEERTLAQLLTYDRDALSDEDRLTYDVYLYRLEHLVDGHRWTYHDYPVHPLVNSYNDELIRGFIEEHPFRTAEDVRDYVAKLSQIARQVGQLLEGLEKREQAGVLPPDFILEMTISRLESDLRSGSPTVDSVDPERLDLYRAFVSGIESIAELDDDTRDALTLEARAQIESSFVPAWITLIEHLKSLRPVVTSDAGVWRLPDGAEYYAYLLRDQTSTVLPAGEIHEIGLREVDRITSEIRSASASLGYPASLGIGEIRARAAREAGFLSGVGAPGGRSVISEYETLIDEAYASTDGVFNDVPTSKVTVVPEPLGSSGFYVPGSADGSRAGAFHAGVAGSAIPRYTMPTITFHETVPGHHLQIALAQELELPLVRRFTHYNGFVEGWALYAERLAAEIGLYKDDPYGNIGRLELELVRAVRLVADTGIHALRWSRDEARAYMESVLGDDSWSHEVDRYVALPGQATGYMIGMNTILELRSEFGDAGGRDLAAFHDLVIGNGSLPLEILSQVVRAAIGS